MASQSSLIGAYLSPLPADQTPIRQCCVDLFRRLVDAENPKCAEHHADIVGRFGRFPHRNALCRKHDVGRTVLSDQRRVFRLNATN
ncbi:DUF924 family protein [Bradyrhizobium sp. URHD0069]|uniref:DUF924 family protein n=1 Tax=Bradyrhizobium sp. URHD0069 TaxID=1380355 RepID=UPI001FDABF87|nr:DUF924 family protein [Bradyrhizobium sp. URHD0069]